MSLLIQRLKARFDPGSAAAHLNLGMLLGELARLPEAEAALCPAPGIGSAGLGGVGFGAAGTGSPSAAHSLMSGRAADGKTNTRATAAAERTARVGRKALLVLL